MKVLHSPCYHVSPVQAIKYSSDKVTKNFAKCKQAHVGMEPSKTNQTRWEHYHNTFTPSLHLVQFLQTVCVNCVWEGLVLCMGDCGVGVMHVLCILSGCAVGGCHFVGADNGTYALSCTQKVLSG